MALFSPSCPCCGKTVPFAKTQWRLGTPFACQGCDAQLVIEKNLWLPILGITAFFVGHRAMPDASATAALFFAIGLAIFVVQRLVMKPERVTPSRD